MARPRVYIHAIAALGPHGDLMPAERRPLAADPPPLVLKELVKSVVGVPLRQASHFVELATIGSQLCLKRLPQPAPENTAVYLGSGFAEMRKNEEVFRQVMPPGPGMASPFDFINTANNMAAFYTARLANLNARNLTITQEEFSFEWALHLAMNDLRAGEYHQALAGGVDENIYPRDQHLRRIALRDDQFIGEGSGWLFLGLHAAGARGELLGVQHDNTGAGLVAFCAGTVANLRQAHEPLWLLPGFRLESHERTALQSALPGALLHDYVVNSGAWPTAAAFGIGSALEDDRVTPGLIVHVNHNEHGHCMVVVLRKFPQ